MNKYENVTFLEYQKKRHEMFDNLGRIGGICDGKTCKIRRFRRTRKIKN